MTIQSVVFVVNDTTTTLEYDSSSGTYKGTITAPSATSGSNNGGVGPGVGAAAANLGYYPAKVVVTDTAGNTTTVDTSDASYGSVLKLKVLETTAPTVEITSPGAGAYLTTNAPTIKATVTDGGSGVKSVYLKTDSGAATELTSGVTISGSTATVSYTLSGLAEGAHTVQMYAVDYDGNTSDTVSRTFTVDTIAPTLNVTSPADALLTNVTTVSVEGTTSDETSSPVTITIAVGSQSYTPTIDSATGAFSQSVTLSVGENTITITATDSAGKATTVTRTVTVDTTAPTITKIELTPNPVDAGKSYIVTVTVTD